MKKILSLIFGLLVFTSLQAFADGKQDALNFFNNYVNAANSYSNTVGDMYSPNAKIIRQVVKPDGTTANAYTDTATYIKQMKIAQAGAKVRGYKNFYSNVTVQDLGSGSYKISSLRQPVGETYKLKTYMIIKKIDGKWQITEEMMQTKQQIFLKYAK
ncbi:hypothetical protein J6P92_06645 [bacterium]|nr:hypothetical protein [bacterium]